MWENYFWGMLSTQNKGAFLVYFDPWTYGSLVVPWSYPQQKTIKLFV